MSRSIKLISSALIVAALAVGVWLAWSQSQSMKRISQLQQGALDPVAHAQSLLATQRADKSAEWVETASAIADQSADHDALAIQLLKAALAENPYFPRGWALLAFLHTRDAGSFTAEAERALERSIEVCPLCSKELLRWRLTFVLEHWTNVSEDTRVAAFVGADLLRWWHLDYEYLSRVRTEALGRGIAFDTYRKKVNSPVRTNEIGVRTD